MDGWIELLPAPGADGKIRGRDGRVYTVVGDLNSVIEQVKRSGIPLVIDINHSSEKRAPKGEESPAMGWISAENMVVKSDGSLWGMPQWTPRGSQVMANKEYKFTSPVVWVDKGLKILGLKNIALVNDPNLIMTALNSAQTEEAEAMDKEVLKALGLAEDATTADVLAAIAKGQKPTESAANAPQGVDIAALVAAEVAKATAAAQANAAAQTVTALVDAAVAAGKVLPAQKDALVAMGNSAGVEGLQAYLATLGPQVKTTSQAPQGQPPKAESNAAEDAEARMLATVFGCDVKDLDSEDNEARNPNQRYEFTLTNAWSPNAAKNKKSLEG